jgi:MoaA/NifB/PqqE/SkfB family radical SAM enzyme
MYSYADIRQVHLEISTRCNAACPDCPRNLRGVDGIVKFPLHDMSLSEAKRIFTTAFLGQLQSILINGNLGDFVTASEGLEIIQYFKAVNPNLQIIISTNAGAKTDIWEELGKLNIIVEFCLDGLEGTHELYRRQTVWSKVIANAKSFISAGGIAHWKMLGFDHNQHEINECNELSKILGFKKFILKKDVEVRNNFPVFDQKRNYLYDIGHHTQSKDFDELLKQYNYIPIKSKLEQHIINCEAKKTKSVYITSTGDVYPCCYLGRFPHHISNVLGNDEVAEIATGNNALDVGIEQAISWFDKVEKSWSGEQLRHCATVCGIKEDVYQKGYSES